MTAVVGVEMRELRCRAVGYQLSETESRQPPTKREHYHLLDTGGGRNIRDNGKARWRT